MKIRNWLKHLVRPISACRPIRNATTRLDLEVLEERCVPTVTGYRPIDEVGNNRRQSDVGHGRHRSHPPHPAAICQRLQHARRCRRTPAPRLISNIVNNQADPANPSQDIATVNQQSLSDFAYSFGQFMDHDMDLTQDNGAPDPIPVPVGDPIGGPNDTPLSFDRSKTDPATGTGPGNPAQQVNSITSYFDLSQIYGSDLATDNALADLRRRTDEDEPGRSAAARQLHLFHSGAIGRDQRVGRRHGGRRPVARSRTCSSRATAAATRTSS